jgi:hypothetical protein
MWDKENVWKVIDRREMLKVKIKSLMAEAAIIRKEENRTKGAIQSELHQHRVGVLRQEARATHLAYGFIRGRAWDRIEAKRRPDNEPTAADWKKVRDMCKRYGPKDFIEPDCMKGK